MPHSRCGLKASRAASPNAATDLKREVVEDIFGERRLSPRVLRRREKGACNVPLFSIVRYRVVVSVSAAWLPPGTRLPVGGLARHKPTRKHAISWT